MVSVGVSALGRIAIHLVDPGVKINLCCREVLRKWKKMYIAFFPNTVYWIRVGSEVHAQNMMLIISECDC